MSDSEVAKNGVSSTAMIGVVCSLVVLMTSSAGARLTHAISDVMRIPARRRVKSYSSAAADIIALFIFRNCYFSPCLSRLFRVNEDFYAY